MKNSGLTEKEIYDIQAVFSNYPQIEEVLIYGSRAKGNYQPASDIDLALKGSGINTSLQTQIEFDLDDLLLPYKFDLSIYDKISNSNFLEHINKVAKTFYQRRKTDKSTI